MKNTNPIKALRNELGLSQTEFGAKLGVSRDVINNIENDRVPLKPALSKLICSQFGVSEAWLETGDGERYPEKDDMTTLMEFAVQMFKDKDLAWIRRVCEYINALTPAERAEVSRYIKGIAGAVLGDTEKEQE